MNLPPWLSHNPVAWAAFANAVIDLAIAFGAPIDNNQKLAIGVLIGIVSTLFVQSQVTSTAKLSSLGVTISPPTQVASVATIIPPKAAPPVLTAAPPVPSVPPAVP